MQQNGKPSTNDRKFADRIKAFMESIGAPPPEVEILKHPTLKQQRVNPTTGETEEVPVEYIPISFVESKLDYYFNGLWEHYHFTFQATQDKIMGSLELAVWHPEAEIWLRRTGVGSVFQQLYEGDGEVAAGDMGYLKSECVKNAAKSLGGMFGRGLNRQNELANYVTVILTEADVEKETRDIATEEELKLYADGLPDNVRNDKRIKNVLNDKRLSLKAAKLTPVK